MVGPNEHLLSEGTPSEATPEEAFLPESLFPEAASSQSPFSLENKESVERLIGYLEPIADLAPTDAVDFGPHRTEFLVDETLRDINIYRDKCDPDRYIVRMEGLLPCSDAIIDSVLIKEAKKLSTFFRRECRDITNPLLKELPNLKPVRIQFAYFPRLVGDKFSMEFVVSYAADPFEFVKRGKKQNLGPSRVNEVMSEITDCYLSRISQFFANQNVPSALYGGMTDYDRTKTSAVSNTAPEHVPTPVGLNPAMAT